MPIHGGAVWDLRLVSIVVHSDPEEKLPRPAVRIPVRFYRSEAGREPVLDWLRDLDKADRHAVGLDLMRVQFGWPIGMPLVRSLQDGLWEVRCNLPRHCIARLLLCFHDETLIVVHSFIKKTQKTTAEDLSLARRRMLEITR